MNIGRASPTIVSNSNPTGTVNVGTTAISVSDTAVVSGGYHEGGNLIFTLHFGTSSGPAVAGTPTPVTLNGDGTYSVTTTLPTSSLAGTYVWTVTYAGDGNNTISFDSGGSSSTVAGIVGAVTINGRAGVSNSLTMDNSGSTVTNIVTLTPTTVGATTGDSFFPAGGSLTYSNIQTLTVDTSNAPQGDSISVFPSIVQMRAQVKAWKVAAVVAVTGANSAFARYLTGLLGKPAVTKGQVICWRTSG